MSIFLHACVCTTCGSVAHMEARNRYQIHLTGAINNYEWSCGYLELNSRPPQEQPVLLSNVKSLELHDC